MGEDLEKRSESKETMKPSIADLELLAYFCMEQFGQKVSGKESSQPTKEGYQKKLEEMREVRTMLGNLRKEGIDTVEGALLETSGWETAERDPGLTEQEHARGLVNLKNLREFLEANRERLPASFLKAKSDIEAELKALEEN